MLKGGIWPSDPGSHRSLVPFLRQDRPTQSICWGPRFDREGRVPTSRIRHLAEAWCQRPDPQTPTPPST